MCWSWALEQTMFGRCWQWCHAHQTVIWWVYQCFRERERVQACLFDQRSKRLKMCRRSATRGLPPLRGESTSLFTVLFFEGMSVCMGERLLVYILLSLVFLLLTKMFWLKISGYIKLILDFFIPIFSVFILPFRTFFRVVVTSSQQLFNSFEQQKENPVITPSILFLNRLYNSVYGYQSAHKQGEYA